MFFPPFFRAQGGQKKAAHSTERHSMGGGRGRGGGQEGRGERNWQTERGMCVLRGNVRLRQDAPEGREWEGGDEGGKAKTYAVTL